MSENAQRLSGKVAVVSGASRGIGAGIAQRLATDGAHVIVNYRSDSDGALQVVTDIESWGGKAVAVQADVGVSSDAARRQSASLPPGSVNVAALRLAIEDVIAEFGPRYLEGPRYLRQLAELERQQSAARDGTPERKKEIEDALHRAAA